MRVTVRFFASHREATGLSSYATDVVEGTTAAAMLDDLATRFPKLKALTPGVAFAINQARVQGEAQLREGDELALLPPMAGG